MDLSKYYDKFGKSIGRVKWTYLNITTSLVRCCVLKLRVTISISKRFKSNDVKVQSNFDGLNIFGTTENCSRHGWLEPLRVNYGTKSGSKWR